MYTCTVGASGPRFFKMGRALELPGDQIFALAQDSKFEGERKVSSFPAQLGLRMNVQPPEAVIQVIGKSRRGDEWFPVGKDQEWLDDGETLSYVSSDEFHEIEEALGELDVSLGSTTFQKCPLIATKMQETCFVDLLVEEFAELGTATAETPQGYGVHTLEADLHDYQKWSVDRLSEFSELGIGAVLADEMGLGKTLQSIAVMVRVVNRGGKVLVVVPSVLIPNWRREFDKFAPSLRTRIHHRPSGSEVFPDEYVDVDVVITAFSALTSTRGDLELINAQNWNLVVVDEAQFIKNPDAKRAISVKEIRRSSSLALTGTPVENSPLDLWSIAEFIFPSLLGERDYFDTAVEVSEEALESVRLLFHPLMIRRTLADVNNSLELPDRVDETEFLQMSHEKNERQLEILASDLSKQSKFNSLVMMAAEAHEDDTLESLIAGSKYRRLEMLIRNANLSGERTLVFCRYRATSDYLRKALEASIDDLYCNVIRGDSGTPEERQGIVDEFASKRRAVLILNPEAAGFGLNITSANNVIHFHPLWNPAKTDQATKRAHRPGQHLVTKVHHLVYEKSVEEVIYERSLAKRDLALRLLEGEELDSEQKSLGEILEQVGRYSIEN